LNRRPKSLKRYCLSILIYSYYAIQHFIYKWSYLFSKNILCAWAYIIDKIYSSYTENSKTHFFSKFFFYRPLLMFRYWIPIGNLNHILNTHFVISWNPGKKLIFSRKTQDIFSQSHQISYYKIYIWLPSHPLHNRIIHNPSLFVNISCLNCMKLFN